MAKGDNEKAVLWFSLAILLDPNNAVLFSNRSAAHANQGKFREALADAEEAIRLNPQWAKVQFVKECCRLKIM